MKLGWIALVAISYIAVVATQKCNLTYIDEEGHFPLVVEDIPPERCPKSSDCCWCGFGNATAVDAWCCLTIACNAMGIKSFEEFAVSVCSANKGITTPGKMLTTCPSQGPLHSSLKMMTSITAESIDPSSTARSPLPTNKIEDLENSNASTDARMAGKRRTAIAVAASLVGTVIIALIVLYLWRRREARKAYFENLYSKASELPTESNIHEIEGRALEKLPRTNSKPCEIMGRSVDRVVPPKVMTSLGPTTARIWESQNTTLSTEAEMRRLAERSPNSTQSLLLNRSPDGYTPSPNTPGERRSSFALSCYKPLPPPPPSSSSLSSSGARSARSSNTQKALPTIGLSQWLLEDTEKRTDVRKK